jgi:hypothetical protein
MESFVELQYLKALEVKKRQAFLNYSSAKRSTFEDKNNKITPQKITPLQQDTASTPV